MKKVIALLAVGAFALAIVACGKKAEEAGTTEDTTKVETVAPADTTSTDTTGTDTTKVQ
jgi:ABC-type enterochelin transport system substrate-binding protein